MILAKDFDGFKFFSDIFLDVGYQISQRNHANKGANQMGSHGNANKDARRDERNKINSGAKGNRGSMNDVSAGHSQR